MSGVVVEQECVDAANKVWSRKEKNVGWATFRTEGDASIVVERLGDGANNKLAGTQEELKAEWDSFVSTLPVDAPRWSVYNFSYISPTDQVTRSKGVFVLYCPGTCKIKSKTMAALYAKKLRMAVCEGEPIEIQAGNHESLDFDDVLAKVLSKLTVK